MKGKRPRFAIGTLNTEEYLEKFEGKKKRKADRKSVRCERNQFIEGYRY